MKGRFLLVCAVGVLAAAAASKSYTVTLYETATIGGAELKPGSYKVDVGEQKAVIHNGKSTSEVPVKVETNASKYLTTSVKVNHENGQSRVEEIHIGGTATKLVLGETSNASSGQ
jgi:hypothetical protein